MKQKAVEWFAKELIKRFKRSQIHYTDSELNFAFRQNSPSSEWNDFFILNEYNPNNGDRIVFLLFTLARTACITNRRAKKTICDIMNKNILSPVGPTAGNIIKDNMAPGNIHISIESIRYIFLFIFSFYFQDMYSS